MTLDLAQRVHDHGYRVDPHVRSLLDTDFYKILMACFIWKNFPEVTATFTVRNRSVRKVRLADTIDEGELRAQLDHVRTLRFTEGELIWLQGNTFYGQRGIFPGDFIEALRGLRMPPYEIGIGSDGDYELTFTGTWLEVTLWEIYALAILNEARGRVAMDGMSKYQLRVLYANATARLVGKLKRLRKAGVPRIAEFGTRRRHGFLWQEFVIEAMAEELGDGFIGTSNALHAMRAGLPAVGTNAHELPMVMASLSRMTGGDTALYESQFAVLRLWQETYGGNLLVGLPDTYGTSQFLAAAPERFPEIADWRGFRLDSKDPFKGAEEMIGFWTRIGKDPREKLHLFSDGLDADRMITLHETFGDRVMDGYGWGTNATNDFRGCDPRGGTALDPISVVCKVTGVGFKGQHTPAVKLSDNYEKASGPPQEVAAYRRVFGSSGVANIPVEV